HARWVSHPWMRSIGKYSYTMYLAHYPLMFLARNEGWEKDWRLVSGSRPPRQILFTLLITVATYGVARLSWVAVEAPALRLKRFVAYPWEKREQDKRSAAQ